MGLLAGIPASIWGSRGRFHKERDSGEADSPFDMPSTHREGAGPVPRQNHAWGQEEEHIAPAGSVGRRASEPCFEGNRLEWSLELPGITRQHGDALILGESSRRCWPGAAAGAVVVMLAFAGALGPVDASSMGDSAGPLATIPGQRGAVQQRRGEGGLGFLAGPRLGLWTHLRASRQREPIVARRLGSMRRMAEYYKVLGAEESDSIDLIKKKYKKLALANHPDLNKSEDATERFMLINEAYEVLSDPVQRYQRSGTVASRSTSSGKPTARQQRTRRYVVGDIVSHKRQEWIGVVLGIDEECTASEEWMKVHGVESLPHGRFQRYFHVLPNLPQEDEHGDETEGGFDEFLAGAELLCKEPAFVMGLSGAANSPSLNTIYVAEDEITPWNLHNEWACKVKYDERGIDPMADGPVKNSVVEKIFTVYSRGRYGHEGNANLLSFTPVTNILSITDKWQHVEQDFVSEEEKLQALRKLRAEINKELTGEDGDTGIPERHSVKKSEGNFGVWGVVASIWSRFKNKVKRAIGRIV